MALPGGQYNYVVMHNGETGTANGTAIDATASGQGAYSAIVIQLVGINGETVTFEATVNGSTWVAIRATNLTDETEASTANADGLYRIIAASLLKVRARISAGGSGTVYAYGMAS